jgi:hypothetical protein
MTEADFHIADRQLALEHLAPSFELLRAYWTRKRADRPMPARADIDPLELRPVLGRIGLIQVEMPGPRFTIRVWGTSLGYRPHGPRDHQDVLAVRPRRYAEMAIRHYAEVCARGEPMLHEIELSFRDMRYRYQRLALPLASDHRNPDMVLTCNGGNDADRELFFEAYAKGTQG